MIKEKRDIAAPPHVRAGNRLARGGGCLGCDHLGLDAHHTFERAEALRAELDFRRAESFRDEVGEKTTTGVAVGVTDVVTGSGTFRAELANL